MSFGKTGPLRRVPPRNRHGGCVGSRGEIAPMKAMLKVVADGLAIACVLPLVVIYRLQCLLVGAARAFPGWSQGMSLSPGLIGAYLRRASYRLVVGRCGSGSWISFGTVCSHSTAEVGRDVYVGVFCC